MSEKYAEWSDKVGLPPGTPVFVGEIRGESTRISSISYNESEYESSTCKGFEDLKKERKPNRINWFNLDGLEDADLIQRVCEDYKIHPLVVEDILNTRQRPKFEDFGSYAFASLKMIYFVDGQDDFEIENVSIVFGKGFLLSFQEKEGDTFDHVRSRLEKGRGIVRKMDADYLAYSLIDAVVDNYFVVIEEMEERVETLEDEILAEPEPSMTARINDMKRDMINLRRSLWPLRELISAFQRSGSDLLNEKTEIYLRDLHDHVIQVIESIDTLRDMLTGILDVYLSSISNKMNEIMKVLTIIATIFIPLTFIAGIYGMNFKYMPELEWKWGYFVTIGVMLLITGVMVKYFQKKKWL